MLPKSNSIDQKDPEPVLIKTEKEIINENINGFRARQLSNNEIKSYSLENKIKFILFNSKLFFIS